MLLWSDVHKLAELVRRGTVGPYLCKDCELPLITQSDQDMNPVFVCISCNRKITPGTNMEANIKAIIREWYI